MSTDTFVVHPLEFPGGNIGTLAIHGTLNDVAMMGARPVYLSAGFVLEEGLSLALLDRVLDAMAEASAAAGGGSGHGRHQGRGAGGRQTACTSTPPASGSWRAASRPVRTWPGQATASWSVGPSAGTA